jgi:hypothetical protein
MHPRPAALLSSIDRAALVVWRRRMTLVIATAAIVLAAGLSTNQGADGARSFAGGGASVLQDQSQWVSELRLDATP